MSMSMSISMTSLLLLLLLLSLTFTVVGSVHCQFFGQPSSGAEAGVTCVQRLFGLARDCPQQQTIISNDFASGNWTEEEVTELLESPEVTRCCESLRQINENECFCEKDIVTVLGEYYDDVVRIYIYIYIYTWNLISLYSASSLFHCY